MSESLEISSKNLNQRFKPILQILKKYWLQWILAVIALILAAAVTLGIPLAFKDLIDVGLDSKKLNEKFVNLLFLSFVLAFLVSARFYIMSWIGERVVADIRVAVFTQVVTKPPEFFETLHTGEVLSRLTGDTTLIQTLVGSSISIALRSLVLFVGGILMMLFTNFFLAAFMVILLFIVVLPVLALGRKVRKISRKSQDKIADASAMAGEVLLNITTVQAFARENFEKVKFSELIENSFKAAKKRITSRSLLTSVAIVLTFSVVVLTLWLGTGDVVNKKITVGELAQFILYAGLVAGSIAALSEVWGDLQRALGATERLVDLINGPKSNSFKKNKLKSMYNNTVSVTANTKIKKKKKIFSGELRFENVFFSYPSRPNEKAISDISFVVKKGLSTALVGPSGAGKSTIFKLILGFYSPQFGKIFFDETQIDNLDLKVLRESVGLVSQEPVVFSANAMENIRYGNLEASDAEVKDAAIAASADKFISKLPEGYETFLGERGVRLSGGQRQRIAIARALLKNPPLLLLDEATSSLDSESEREIQRALDILLPGKTSIVIAHRLSTVTSANKILVFDNGIIVEKGTHIELVKKKGLYTQLASNQFFGNQNE